MAGFGSLLALMVVAGVSALSVLGDLHAREQTVRRALLQRTESVALIRLSVYRYSEGVESYLRTQSPAAPDLSRMAAATDAAVSAYPAERDAQERALIETLARLLAGHRLVLQSTLSWTGADHRTRARQILDQQVLPVNARLSDTVQEISVCVGRQLSDADQQMQAGYDSLHKRLNKLLLVTLAAGLLLSVASAIYIFRLQQETDARYRELASSRLELRDLSARLIDAQETERRSIARELHDEVGQSLGAMLVDIGRLAARIPESDTGTREQLGQLRQVAETAAGTVRNIALLLRPSMLDDLGLVAALEWQAREMSRRGDMEVEVDSDRIPADLPDEYNTAIYRLVQEALNNAARHAGAKNARVRVEPAEGRIRVIVSDDGRGFDPRKTRGMGILGMQERVHRLGGILSIDSQRGGGTRLNAELPLPAVRGS